MDCVSCCASGPSSATACVRWCRKKADDKSTSGKTGESDWALCPVVVVRRVLNDLLDRFSDENGLGGIFLDDLGSVLPSVVGAAAVGEVAVLLLGTFTVAVCVSESVCDPSYRLGMRERTDLSERWGDDPADCFEEDDDGLNGTRNKGRSNKVTLPYANTCARQCHPADTYATSSASK